MERKKIENPLPAEGVDETTRNANRNVLLESYLIAKAKTLHSIGKSLVMPVTVIITEILCGRNKPMNPKSCPAQVRPSVSE
jgi:hypothetical protein